MKWKKDITKDQWPLKILVDFNKIKTFVLYNISTKIKRWLAKGENICKQMFIVRKITYI